MYQGNAEDGDHDGAMLIIATPNGLQRIAESPTIIGDGTFKRCPALFAQQV